MLPQPNQIDDLKRHIELGRKAQEAAERGHRLLAEGKKREAQRALSEAEDAMEKRALIQERWR
jgi:hypothetical protein